MHSKSTFAHITEFTPDERGFIRHWICSGPTATPLSSPDTPRRGTILPTPKAVPTSVTAGGPGPDGKRWLYHSPGSSWFIERDGFYHSLQRLGLWAAADFVSNRAFDLNFRVWTPNTLDLWCGATHCLRYDASSPGNTAPSVVAKMSLLPGRTRVLIHLQERAFHHTSFQFGLEALDGEGLRIAMPGAQAITPALVAVDGWLDSVSPNGCRLTSAHAPGVPVDVILDRQDSAIHRTWPRNEAELRWHEDGITAVHVSAKFDDHKLERRFERPTGDRLTTPGESAEDYHLRYLEQLAFTPSGSPRRTIQALLARHTLDRLDREADEEILLDTLDYVSQDLDGSDDRLAVLLRLYALGWGHTEQRRRIELVVAGQFEKDERPGPTSEANAIQAYTCRLLSATLVREIREGSGSADTSDQPCLEWLSQRESGGFEAFLSGNLACITFASLLNLVDFAQNEEIKSIAARLCDRLLRQQAEHTFDGVTIGPHGAADRRVLTPHASGNQGLLSFAISHGVVESFTPWATFLATSEYRPPGDLCTLNDRPITRTYHEAGRRITLYKTLSAMLSSVNVKDAQDADRSDHLWHATLSRQCHVFVNHPSTPGDGGDGSRGFWNGNSVTPKVAQEGNVLFQVFNIPEDHPVGFTHAHWPADVFDETIERDGWYLGRVPSGGMIGLWCSQPTQIETDVLARRELRAWGRQVAWICVCGTPEIETTAAFADACHAHHPNLRSTFQLTWDGEVVL